MNWQLLLQKEIPPPFNPVVNGESDVSNFHEGSTHILDRFHLPQDSLIKMCHPQWWMTRCPQLFRAQRLQLVEEAGFFSIEFVHLSRTGSFDDTFQDFSYTDPSFVVTQVVLHVFNLTDNLEPTNRV